jgi:hypothetical protein
MTRSSSNHSVHIAGKEFALTYELVPLGQVRLDPDNPRLRQKVQKFRGKEPTQEQLRDVILDLDHVGDLQADIRTSKGLLEPIYVSDDGLVVEGNCRMAVFLRLHDTFKQEATWKKIPVYRFPKSLGKREQAIFQAKYHITSGKSPWEAYEKANHIFHMHAVLKMSIADIADALHPKMRSDTVQRNLDTYREFTSGHLGIADGTPQTTAAVGGATGGTSGTTGSGGRTSSKPTKGKSKAGSKTTASKKVAKKADGKAEETGEPSVRAWSFYEEFYKRKALAPYRKTAEDKKWFSDLVKSKKLGRAENVRQLPTIFQTPGAKEVLVKDGFEAAMKIVMKKDPTAGSPLFKVLSQAVDALGKFEHSEIARLKKEAKQQSIIQTLHDKLTSLAEAADIELEGHDA